MVFIYILAESMENPQKNKIKRSYLSKKEDLQFYYL